MLPLGEPMGLKCQEKDASDRRSSLYDSSLSERNQEPETAAVGRSELDKEEGEGLAGRGSDDLATMGPRVESAETVDPDKMVVVFNKNDTGSIDGRRFPFCCVYSGADTPTHTTLVVGLNLPVPECNSEGDPSNAIAGGCNHCPSTSRDDPVEVCCLVSPVRLFLNQYRMDIEHSY